MTSVNLASIPNNINTYERLFIWCAQCLQSISNGTTVNVVGNEGDVPVAQVQTAVIADGTDRFIVSAYIPLDRDGLNSSTAKTWMAADDISTATPHTNLLSN